MYVCSINYQVSPLIIIIQYIMHFLPGRHSLIRRESEHEFDYVNEINYIQSEEKASIWYIVCHV